MNEYEYVRKNGYSGFAEFYLNRCQIESESNNEIDIQVYSGLVKLDSRLGTTVTEQLFRSLFYSLNLDLIKVCIQGGANFTT